MAFAQALQRTFVDCELADVDLVELYFERGWTDGLPVVPPTHDKVDAVVRPSAAIQASWSAKLLPRWGALTREVLAINMVMAGCKPEYAPVVRAALLALTDPRVQSQRRAGHYPHGFTTGDRQRSDCARDRHERRRQCLRLRQPGQCHHRPRNSADHA